MRAFTFSQRGWISLAFLTLGLTATASLLWAHPSDPSCAPSSTSHTHYEGNCTKNTFCVTGTGCVDKITDVACETTLVFNCCDRQVTIGPGQPQSRKFDQVSAIGDCAPASGGSCVLCDKVICATGHQAATFTCNVQNPPCSQTVCAVAMDCAIIRTQANRCK
jgi:hypothetical protein